MLRKRAKKLQRRRELFKEMITSEVTKKIMDQQSKDMEVRIRDTMNKITREKIGLMRLKKTLAQEFDWPVEELLR